MINASSMLQLALSHKSIVKDSQRISKIKPFNYYRGKDWKKFELNNKSIALNILYVSYNTKEIRHA